MYCFDECFGLRFGEVVDVDCLEDCFGFLFGEFGYCFRVESDCDCFVFGVDRRLRLWG